MTKKTAKQHEDKDKGQHELGSALLCVLNINFEGDVTFKMVAYYE